MGFFSDLKTLIAHNVKRDKNSKTTYQQHKRYKSLYDTDGLNTIQNKYEIKNVIKTHTHTRISVEIKTETETKTK